MKFNSNSRRDFLKKSAVLGSVLAFPSIIPSGRLGADKVKLACIGIGNQGASDIRSLYKSGYAEVVALCDVDMGAEHTQAIMGMFPKAKRFQDFRTMFDEFSGNFEAVTIGVPDHSHFPITMRALAEGKHVYVEKPMARTYQEVDLMMKAAAKNPKLVTQMGNQGHSGQNYFQFKAWKEAGIIKDVTAVTAHMNSPRRWHGWDQNMKSFPAAEAIPSTLDWDVWHGVRPIHDYNHDFINGQWRCWYDFGMGALGDWGAHLLDTVHQFLELGLPYEINMKKASGHNEFFYPFSSTIEFKFPERGDMPPVDITWYDGIDNLPPIPSDYGNVELDPNIPPASNGAIKPSKLNPGKIIYSKELSFKGGSHSSTLSVIGEKAKSVNYPEVPESPSDHYANYLLSCMGKEETRSPFHIAGPLSQIFCLGVLAQRLNTDLKFDRKKEKITNNKLANELLTGEPPRKGWEEYYKL